MTSAIASQNLTNTPDAIAFEGALAAFNDKKAPPSSQGKPRSFSNTVMSLKKRGGGDESGRPVPEDRDSDEMKESDTTDKQESEETVKKP